MQIIIDTRQCPCRELNDECGISENECYEDDICATCPLIRNGGIKLPKGHGDLIDRSQLLTVTECMEDGTERCYVPYAHIEEAETIIEAESKG